MKRLFVSSSINPVRDYCNNRQETSKSYISKLADIKFLFLVIIALFCFSTLVSATQHADTINKQFTSSSTFLWKPKTNGTISSLKIDGEIFGEGDVTVNMIKGGNKYLIFKRSISNEEINLKDHIEIQEGTNIGLILKYGNGNWDSNNDGIVSNDEGIDFKLDPLFFSQYDPYYLCTLWEVYSVDNEEINAECYGSNKCCNFLGQSAIVDEWDEDYVLLKGQAESTSRNIVLARIVYYDGTDIEYSNQDGLGAFFIDSDVDKQMNFTYESLFDSNNYFLEINLENDTIFDFKEIQYNIETKEDPIIAEPTHDFVDNYTTSDNEPTNIPPFESNLTPVVPINKPDYVKKDSKIITKNTNNSFYFFANDFSNLTRIKIDNENILIDEIILNDKILFDTWFKVENKNDSNYYQSLDLKSNYYDLAIINFKIPKDDLEGHNLSVYNSQGKINYIQYKNDSNYVYYRITTKLHDLDFYLKEIKPKSASSELRTYFRNPNVNPLFYFIFAIIFSITLLILYDIPLKVYEKYKSFRFAEKEIKIGEEILEKEEMKMVQFLRKRHAKHDKKEIKKIEKKKKKEKILKAKDKNKLEKINDDLNFTNDSLENDFDLDGK